MSKDHDFKAWDSEYALNKAKHNYELDKELWRNPKYSDLCLSCGKEYYPVTLEATRLCPGCRDKYRKSCADKEVVGRIFDRLLNDPVGTTKEGKMGEKTFVLEGEAIKAAPHLSNYARNSEPVTVIRFDGDNVGSFFEALTLSQITVYPVDKVTKQSTRAVLCSSTVNITVEEGQHLVIEDGKVYVLDEETFEARYEKVASPKQVYAPTKKKARK